MRDEVYGVTAGVWLAASLLAVCAGILLLEAILGTPYPHFLYATAAILVIDLYFIIRYGLFSVPTIATGLLTYPALVPFLTTVVLGARHYTPYALQFESVRLASKIVWLVAILLVIFAAVLRLLEARGRRQRTGEEPSIIDRLTPGWLPRLLGYEMPTDRTAFVILSGVLVLSAYLHAPGPTILSATYEGSANYQPGWATWAGSTFKAAFALLFLTVLQSKVTDRRFLAFLGVVGATVVWLLLHGRRVESVGIVLLLFVDVVKNRAELSNLELVSTARGLSVSAAFSAYLGTIVLVGRLRNIIGTVELGLVRSPASQEPSGGSAGSSSGGSSSGESSSGGADTVRPGDSVDVVGSVASSLQYGNGRVGLPGGAHGIYGTMRATVHVFDEGKPLLNGRTFLNYVPQSIPTPILVVVGYTPPQSYTDLLASTYAHNGGNYFMNVYYANFGSLGLLLAGAVLAVLVHVTQKSLEQGRPRPTVATAVAAVLFINLARALWYTQLNWIDTLQGLVIVGLLVVATSRLGYRLSSVLPTSQAPRR